MFAFIKHERVNKWESVILMYKIYVIRSSLLTIFSVIYINIKIVISIYVV